MQEISYKEQLKTKDFEIIDFVKRSGEFETDDKRRVPWKNFNLKAKVGGIVMNFKLDRVFNDTMEEVLENK